MSNFLYSIAYLKADTNMSKKSEKDNVNKPRFITDEGIAYAVGCSKHLVKGVRLGERKDKKRIVATIQEIKDFLDQLRERNLSSDN